MRTKFSFFWDKCRGTQFLGHVILKIFYKLCMPTSFTRCLSPQAHAPWGDPIKVNTIYKDNATQKRKHRRVLHRGLEVEAPVATDDAENRKPVIGGRAGKEELISPLEARGAEQGWGSLAADLKVIGISGNRREIKKFVSVFRKLGECMQPPYRRKRWFIKEVTREQEKALGI